MWLLITLATTIVIILPEATERAFQCTLDPSGMGGAPCALGPSRRRPTSRGAVPARPRRKPPRKNATVATEEGQLM